MLHKYLFTPHFMSNNTKEHNDNSSLYIYAGLFLGLGFGFIFNQLVGAMFVGLGIGFLVSALLKSNNTKSSKAKSNGVKVKSTKSK
jgi:F0F1-type ATP synthase assembly protein I